MRALLDTHTFLWFNTDDPRLSAGARAFISDGTNQLLLSAASAWEIAIKFERGRMADLAEVPEAYVPARMRLYGIEALPIVMTHTFQVAHLPLIHRDPIDRLLVSQCLVERLPIVTNDSEIVRYGVDTIW